MMNFADRRQKKNAESLEPRLFFHAGHLYADDEEESSSVAPSVVVARINFQPKNSPVPQHYLADVGLVFGRRAGGAHRFGWDRLLTDFAFDRDSTLVPDQRYDTGMPMQTAGNATWEYSLPNGEYTVRVVAGDPASTYSNLRINVEGVPTVKGETSAQLRTLEGTARVIVADGRLTLRSGPAAVNNAINFVEILRGRHTLPMVRVAAIDSKASESPGNTATFRIDRGEPAPYRLTVLYETTGRAKNGEDYNALSGTVIVPAGKRFADITLTGVPDSLVEGTESAGIFVTHSVRYTTDTASSAIARISDQTPPDPQPPAPNSLSWSARSVGFGRSEAMGAALGGRVFVFGGYTSERFEPVARVDQYDPATNKWFRMKDMPLALTHAGVVSDGAFVYLAGGYPPGANGRGQTFSTTAVRRYDPRNDTWVTLPALPQARGGGALAVVGRNLYLIGGSDAQRKDRAEVFVLNLDETGAGWSTRAAMPAPRNHFAAVNLNGRIYAVAGQTGQDAATSFKQDVFVYTPATNSWAEAAPLINQPRSHAAVSTIVHNGRILVVGGETDSNVVGRPKLLANVEMYDPATNRWSVLTSLPSPRTSGIGVSLGGNQILFTTGQGGGFRGDTWIGTLT